MDYHKTLKESDENFYKNSIFVSFVLQKCFKSTSSGHLFDDEKLCVENMTRRFLEAKKIVNDTLEHSKIY